MEDYFLGMSSCAPAPGDSIARSVAKAFTLLASFLRVGGQGMTSIVEALNTPVCSLRHTFVDYLQFTARRATRTKWGF